MTIPDFDRRYIPTRIRTDNGEEIPAWVVGHTVCLFSGGDSWLFYHTPTGVLGENESREEAARVAELWAACTDATADKLSELANS